jgi:hypothetical protein
MEDTRNEEEILVGKTERKRPRSRTTKKLKM